MTSSDEKSYFGEASSKSSSFDAAKSAGWNIADENPFRYKEGVRAFRELYTGKRKKDRAAWADYFVSDGFLEGYQKWPFLELLWETVKKNQDVYPLSKEFITELMIAYGLKSLEDAEKAMHFRGIEYICEILRMGPKVTRFKGNDFAMMAGFRDYQVLLMLAASNWEDEEYLHLGRILEHYLSANLSDRPIRDANMYELSQRHPKSLKLITHFFTYEKLPSRAYLAAWNHLWLQNATVGKEKLFFGKLREIVLERVPELVHKPRVTYKQLLNDFYAYDRSSAYYSNKGETSLEQAQMDYFFARQDVMEALHDDIFVEEQVLHYWITKGSSAYLLKRLQAFYKHYSEAPFAKTVISKIEMMLGDRRIEFELQEDERTNVQDITFDLTSRACVRYYLNTAFPLAYGEQKILLSEYLDEQMPVSIKWNQIFCDTVKPMEYFFGEHTLTIIFHSQYIEYLWDQKPIVPSYPGRALLHLEDETLFWLLLPIAAASQEDYKDIYKELVCRLERLPVYQENISVIADGIAGKICRFEEYDMPLFTIYAEKGDDLYGCDIYGNAVLKLYEQTRNEKYLLPNGTHRFSSIKEAIAMGQRLLQERVSDALMNVVIEVLPDKILVEDLWGSSWTLAEKQVTKKVILELLKQYFEGMIKRLELAWKGGSLLFIRDGKQYACFYFNHTSQDWYALVALPEVYAVVDCKDVEYEPFLLGMLPNYLIHQNPNLIREQLVDIFAQTACGNPYPKMMMWSPQIYRFETRQRYRLAKHQFGLYPAKDTENQILDRFYIPNLPAFVYHTDLLGKESGKVAVEKDKAMVQRILSEYLGGRLKELVLSWQYDIDKFHYRHILLMKDEKKHLMIYLDDSVKGMDYLVADVSAYINAEENQYRKENFYGKAIPGYLIHTDMRRIRDYLDFLIPQMGYAIVNLGEFGEFSYCNGKAYQLIGEELTQKGLW